jgi:N-formylglutamate amidohydrolase
MSHDGPSGARGAAAGATAQQPRGERPPLEIIEAHDLDLPPDAGLPFRFTPAAEMTPVVASFPHVGLRWPHELGPKPQVSFGENADYEVHTVFGELAPLGVASLRAVFSRLVVDLNRAADDVSPALVVDHPAPRPRTRPGDASPAARPHEHRGPGRGVVWDTAIGNVPLLDAPLPYRDFARRIARYHEPYHRAIELLMQRRVDRFGYAILLDGHSMPSIVGVDLVVGTLDGTSCAAELRRLAMDTLQVAVPVGERPTLGLSVRLDQPYRGGEVVRRAGRPTRGWHALQLEINRALYMDERTLELWAEDEARGAGASSLRRGHGGARRRTSAPLRTDPAAVVARLAQLRARVRRLVLALTAEAPRLALVPGGAARDPADPDHGRAAPRMP